MNSSAFQTLKPTHQKMHLYMPLNRRKDIENARKKDGSFQFDFGF